VAIVAILELQNAFAFQTRPMDFSDVCYQVTGILQLSEAWVDCVSDVGLAWWRSSNGIVSKKGKRLLGTVTMEYWLTL
jgi:hypothetical protein